VTVPHFWEWTKRNISAIETKAGSSLGMIGGVISTTMRGFTSQEKLDDVDSFFAMRDTRNYDRALAQVKEAMLSKIEWVGRDRKDVKTWLGEKGYLSQ
jgi:aminopeptidase 2